MLGHQFHDATVSQAVNPRVGSPSSSSTRSSLSETGALSDEGTSKAGSVNDRSPSRLPKPSTSLHGSVGLIARTRVFLEVLASSMSEETKACVIRMMLPHVDVEIQRCLHDAGWSQGEATGQHSWKQISAELQSLSEQRRQPQTRDLCALDASKFPKDIFPQGLLFPQNLETQKIMEEESVAGYLAFCKTNMLAEYWAMLNQQVSYDEDDPSKSPQAGWIAKNLKKLRVNVSAGEELASLDVLPNTDNSSILELMGACVIVNGRLGITSSRLQCLCDNSDDDGSDDDDDDDNVKIFDGKHCNPMDCKGPRWVDVRLGARIDTLFGGEDKEYDATQKKFVYSFGSIRDFVVALNAIESIKEHATHTDGSEASECECCATRMCEMVADPSKRVESTLLPLTSIPEAITLNEEQRECLLGLRYSLEAVQGPPGTGKTTLIHAAVQAVSVQHPAAVTLVACVQNQAIENLALRFASTAETLPFVVLAQQSNDRLGKCARYWALDSQVDRDPTVEREQAWYEATKAQYSANKAQYKASSDFSQRLTRKEQAAEAKVVMDDAWTSLQQSRREARARLVASARGVLTTITSSTHWLREATRGVDCMIVDEAGNAPDAQMPQLLLHKPQLLLLVGDHKQLPPFSRVSDGSPVSLLERVFRKLKDSAPTLTRQYRMHPRICNFVSQAFYSNRLVADPSVKHAELNPDTPGLFQGIVLDLYESRRAGAEIREGTSYWNYTEVVKTMLALRRLAALLPASKTMAVISFYKAQVWHLQAQAAEVPALQALVDCQRLRILSVDACQGSEADVVILNCVRSLPLCARAHPLRFFGNEHRFCVATSRAKHLLLVVGCSSTLEDQARFFPHVRLLATKPTAVAASAVTASWQLLSQKLAHRRFKQRMDVHASRRWRLRDELSAFF